MSAARAGVLGALAGLVGGLAFGAAMAQLGFLPTVASLVSTDSPLAGFGVHMVIAAVLGAGFGVLVRRQRPGAGETLFWGLAYGTLWWLLGPLTLLPPILDEPITWSIGAARAEFPSLLGHLLYGAAMALAFALLQVRRGAVADAMRITWGALVRGALAGLAGALLFEIAFDAANRFGELAPALVGGAALLAWLGLGTLLGLGYALLYPDPSGTAGAALVRGAAYGFLWWAVGALTLIPLIGGGAPTWSVDAARASYETFPGLMLCGASVALLYKWLGALARALLSDDVGPVEDEASGARALRATGWGALAGIPGGLLFTVVMVQVGFLPTVARLVGSTSQATGLGVHLLISAVIGSSYGLLFRGQSYDNGSALGWGATYGVLWWLLGALTLLPMLLGGAPLWSAAAAAASFPSLVGHLAYGAALGVTFHRLEARHNPWWVTRTEAQADRARQRREQVLSSAPALWVLFALVVAVPLLLAP